ncbi:hypothetical protein Bbelb_388330, partial [Branchiostoma belcheri]
CDSGPERADQRAAASLQQDRHSVRHPVWGLRQESEERQGRTGPYSAPEGTGGGEGSLLWAQVQAGATGLPREEVAGSQDKSSKLRTTRQPNVSALQKRVVGIQFPVAFPLPGERGSGHIHHQLRRRGEPVPSPASVHRTSPAVGAPSPARILLSYRSVSSSVP